MRAEGNCYYLIFKADLSVLFFEIFTSIIFKPKNHASFPQIFQKYFKLKVSSHLKESLKK